jgi:hypothetical protein
MKHAIELKGDKMIEVTNTNNQRLQQKLLINIIVLILTVSVSYSQSISPQSINTGGAEVANSNGSISFIIGDVISASQYDTLGNNLRSGFSAGTSLSTLRIKESNIEEIDINVFPNPTSEILNIHIIRSRIEQIVVSITDILGNEMFSGQFEGTENTIGINTGSYSSGNYILIIKDVNKRELCSYKVIKH